MYFIQTPGQYQDSAVSQGVSNPIAKSLCYNLEPADIL